MKIYCSACLDNKKQRDNLCQCVALLGGHPELVFSDVVLEFEGSKEQCEGLIQLFEQYPRHGIYTEENP